MAGEKVYTVSGPVGLFPQKGGWQYLAIPSWISDEGAAYEDRGVIAVRATVGSTTWDTSLLATGERTHFIELNAAVRAADAVNGGDEASLQFRAPAAIVTRRRNQRDSSQ